MESLLKNLKRHLECSICRDTYNETKTISSVYTHFAVSVWRIMQEPANSVVQSVKRKSICLKEIVSTVYRFSARYNLKRHSRYKIYPKNTSESLHVDSNQKKRKYRVIFLFLNSFKFRLLPLTSKFHRGTSTNPNITNDFYTKLVVKSR